MQALKVRRFIMMKHTKEAGGALRCQRLSPTFQMLDAYMSVDGKVDGNRLATELSFESC
jgi:hypothetical protein